jgi:hypothetical protein
MYNFWNTNVMQRPVRRHISGFNHYYSHVITFIQTLICLLLLFQTLICVDLGLDPGDRQVLEQRFQGFDPPCLLDSSDGRSGSKIVFVFFLSPYSRFVLKGSAYNPMDVMNCLIIRRGYKMQGDPQQRTLPNIHNKDDK